MLLYWWRKCLFHEVSFLLSLYVFVFYENVSYENVSYNVFFRISSLISTFDIRLSLFPNHILCHSTFDIHFFQTTSLTSSFDIHFVIHFVIRHSLRHSLGHSLRHSLRHSTFTFLRECTCRHSFLLHFSHASFIIIFSHFTKETLSERHYRRDILI